MQITPNLGDPGSLEQSVGAPPPAEEQAPVETPAGPSPLAETPTETPIEASQPVAAPSQEQQAPFPPPPPPPEARPPIEAEVAEGNMENVRRIAEQLRENLDALDAAVDKIPDFGKPNRLPQTPETPENLQKVA